MPTPQSNNPHIVGLTGSFGSGCTYIADKVLVDQLGYRKLSLSDILRQVYRDRTGNDPDKCERQELQAFGDDIRKNEGADFLARKALESIELDQNQERRKWLIDSLRNPEEIKVFRDRFRHFFVLGIYADREVRWHRVQDKYHRNRQRFEADDLQDTGEDSPRYGQRVGDCFFEADVVLSNEQEVKVVGNQEFKALSGRVGQYVELISQPLTRRQPIRQAEALMAMAYAASQQSSCSKRKVGAVIADELGNVISSGFNEVPGHENPCATEYTRCYRDWSTDQFFDELAKEVPAVEGHTERIKTLFRKQFKNLDLCRALHAEENAIVNLAKNGRSVPLEKCTLYTTTYPCRLCANKIVNVGIKQIVFLQPYPDQVSKTILQEGGVDSRFFEGVTFKAYFRIYGEEK